MNVGEGDFIDNENGLMRRMRIAHAHYCSSNLYVRQVLV
jgi:hypothetical protein